jgi:hypothetical protein
MDKLTVKEFNATTGKEIVRDMTKEEMSENQALQETNKEREALIQAKKLSRQSALAKLIALGIDENEAASLLS